MACRYWLKSRSAAPGRPCSAHTAVGVVERVGRVVELIDANLGRYDGIQAECYCGIGADLLACEFDAEFVPTGPCADVVLAGLEGHQGPVVGDIPLSIYPTGRAYPMVDEASRICADVCGFQ